MLDLGRVIGLMLNRHSLQSPGTASLVFEQLGQRPTESRLYWRSADVWRVETRGGAVGVSDGQHRWEWSNGRRWQLGATRLGHPAWDLQLVFPLRAHIWGRKGDDYYMAGTAETESPNAVRVQLAGIEDVRPGWIDVDTATGCIVAADYQGDRLWLRDFSQVFGGFPDEFFTLTEHGD